MAGNNRLKILSALASANLVIFGGPALAQSTVRTLTSDRTVAGEKAVVTKVLVGGIYLGGNYYAKMDILKAQNPEIGYTVHQPRILSAVSTGLCVDHVSVGPMTIDLSYRDDRREGVVLLTGADLDLNWSELVSVRSDGKNVQLLWKGASRESSIVYGDASSATRVSEALETLRRACALPY